MGVIKTYTAAELDLLGSFPVRVRVYGAANPASKAVIYVHGANENAHNIEDFDATLELANIKDSPNSHLIEFFYQQDKGCTAEPTPYIAMPTTDTSTGIHVDSHFSSDDRCPSYTGHCDSQSSISENVRKLHTLVQQEYLTSGTPVVLVGYSMGAAIIRGVLTYSLLRGDDVADSMIDTVITVAGAHDGSNDAACAYGSACDVWSQILVRSKARQAIRRSGFNRDRPAVYDLAAGDDWYEWANQPEAELPPHIAYFNFYADIDAQYCANGTIPSLNGGFGAVQRMRRLSHRRVGRWGLGCRNAGAL